MDPLADLGEEPLLAKVGKDQHNLPEPGRGTGNSARRGLDHHRSIGDILIWTSLLGMSDFLPSKEAHVTLTC
jgi:hypothetical protein